MNIKKLNEEIEKLLENEPAKNSESVADFKVGDNVKTKWSSRPGVITKQISSDVFEVEYPEFGTNMARTDRHYSTELQLI